MQWHLTRIQVVDLFVGAKTAKGVSPKTSAWYLATIRTAVASR